MANPRYVEPMARASFDDLYDGQIPWEDAAPKTQADFMASAKKELTALIATLREDQGAVEAMRGVYTPAHAENMLARLCDYLEKGEGA